MPESFTPPSIVVGVDGSPDAARAALWAVDEALSRDIELRLVAVAKSASDDRAQQSLNTAAEAVRSAGRAVRIQTAILAGAPIPALLEQSQAAAMICVGALGLTQIGHSQAGSIDHVRVGSTAGALVASAHCPVAVVRSSGRPAGADPGWVTVEVDETPDSATVLQFGVEEARLRGAPLRVLGAWQSRFTDVHDDHAVAEGDQGRLLFRRLAGGGGHGSGHLGEVSDGTTRPARRRGPMPPGDRAARRLPISTASGSMDPGEQLARRMRSRRERSHFQR